MAACRIVSSSVVLVTFALRAFAQGQISGRIVDHAGGPVVNGRVRLVPLTSGTLAPAGPSAASQRHGNAVAGPGGGFSLTGIAPGLYRACADLPGRELLDPCLWERTPVPVTVGDRPLSGISVQLKRGATLSIRVDDAGKALANAEKAGKGMLLVGVWSANGVFHPARVTSEDSGGRTYSLEVPVGVTAKVTLTPSSLRLQDTAGRALGAGGASTDVAMGPAGHALRYSVAAP